MPAPPELAAASTLIHAIIDDIHTRPGPVAVERMFDAVADTFDALISVADDVDAVANYRGYTDHGPAGAAEVIDPAVPMHRIVLDAANCVLAFTAPTAAEFHRFTLLVVQDATGGRTITCPASVDWPAAAAPVLTAAANARDILTFLTVDGGVTWFGMIAGQAFA